jgi:hypothetical protein
VWHGNESAMTEHRSVQSHNQGVAQPSEIHDESKLISLTHAPQAVIHGRIIAQTDDAVVPTAKKAGF